MLVRMIGDISITNVAEVCKTIDKLMVGVIPSKIISAELIDGKPVYVECQTYVSPCELYGDMSLQMVDFIDGKRFLESAPLSISTLCNLTIKNGNNMISYSLTSGGTSIKLMRNGSYVCQGSDRLYGCVKGNLMCPSCQPIVYTTIGEFLTS